MQLSILSLVSVVLISCSKTDANENEATRSNFNFYALTVGNSWAYKNYKYNSATNLYEDTGVIDSISIIGTQSFSGETYYKFRILTTGNEEEITFCNPNGESFEFWRESDGNLINEQDIVKFTNSNYEERI